MLDDVDFVIHKEEILQKIKALFPEKKNHSNIGMKISRFLLHPEIIPLLEERMQLSKTK